MDVADAVFRAAVALCLASVFAVAAVAKARRPRATALAFAALGLPVPALLARAIVVAEGAAAITVVAAPRLGGVGSTLLLVAFTVVVAFARRSAARRGVAIRCGCFGVAGDPPVTATTLARNGVLLAGAMFVAVHPPSLSSAPRLAIATSALGLVAITALALSLADLSRATGGIVRPRPRSPHAGNEHATPS